MNIRNVLSLYSRQMNTYRKPKAGISANYQPASFSSYQPSLLPLTIVAYVIYPIVIISIFIFPYHRLQNRIADYSNHLLLSTLPYYFNQMYEKYQQSNLFFFLFAFSQHHQKLAQTFFPTAFYFLSLFILV